MACPNTVNLTDKLPELHQWAGRRKASGLYPDDNEKVEIDDGWTLNTVKKSRKWKGAVQLAYDLPKIKLIPTDYQPHHHNAMVVRPAETNHEQYKRCYDSAALARKLYT